MLNAEFLAESEQEQEEEKHETCTKLKKGPPRGGALIGLIQAPKAKLVHK